jgi:protoheme IX farnesyltransferase
MTFSKSYVLQKQRNLALQQKGMIGAYYELVKPGIVYSNALTAAAGFLFAARGGVDFAIFVALIAGTSLIIASACVFNNYIDRKIDFKMTRTKNRAIASGKVEGRNAVVYAVLLGLLGFVVLSRTNRLTLLIGASAFIGYVIIYGIAKRQSVHGTLVGTFPGAASLVAGYSAAVNRLDHTALLLFFIMLSWQMAHFYSIAIYRLNDYKTAKIPVMPAVKGIAFTKKLILLYICGFTIAAGLLWQLGNLGFTYLIVMSGLCLWWLRKGLLSRQLSDDIRWARGMFGVSLVVLMALSVLLGLNSWLP